MAKLIGYLKYGHHAGTVHRLAHKAISSSLRTWHGSIDPSLDKDGNARVSVNGKVVWEGNVEGRLMEDKLESVGQK